MNRSLILLLGALALGSLVFAGSFFASQRTCMLCKEEPKDELAWLRQEFHVSPAEMARIRQLHAGYLPKCAEMCAKIAAKKRELDSALGQGTNLTPEVNAKISELAELRKQCQTQMLEHFVRVSQTMPPAEGQRYLAEMKRVTLGLHGQTEQDMSGESGHEHQH